MTLGPNGFRTPKGEDFSEADSSAETISAAGTYVPYTGTLDPVGKLADVEWNDGNSDFELDFAQVTKMRFQATASMEPASGTDELNLALFDSDDNMLAEATAAEATATTPTDYTFDAVVKMDPSKDYYLGVVNNDTTANVTVNSAEVSIWHP